MTWELKGFCIGNLTANADLSSNQFYCVKAHTSNNQFALCDTDGEVVLGILQDKPGSGESGDILCMGVSKVVAAETLSAGDRWGTSSAGKAKKIEGSVTGADVGDYWGGVVLEGAASDELASVTVGLQNGEVEAQ